MSDFDDWFDREVETGILYSENVLGSLGLSSDRMERYLRDVMRSAFEAGRKDAIPRAETAATMSDDVKREIEAWASGVREGLTAPNLIPRAEAEAMVAAAVKKAAGVCASLYKGERHQDAYDQGHDDGLDFAEQRIEALTPADARAALDKKLAKALDKKLAKALEVKPLEWKESYGVHRAETPFGTYIARGEILTFNRVDSMGPDPMDRAQADFARRVQSCLKGGDDE